MKLRSIKFMTLVLPVGCAGLSPSSGADAAEPIRIIALKAAIEKAGKVDKEAIVDALSGLVIPSPTGPVTINQDHHATMNMFIAKTQGNDLVSVRALGEIVPQPGCKLADR